MRRTGAVLAASAVLLLAGCAPAPAGALAPLSTTRSASPVPTSPAPTTTPMPTPTPAATSPTIRIVTIGDSIMAGYGLQADDAWPDLLAASDGLPVVNLGCSGAGFVVQGSCGTNFAGLISSAVAYRPDVVVIESSDNDMGQSDAELSAATSSTVAALHAALPEARIVGLSTLWDQPSAEPEEIRSSSLDLDDAVTAVGGTYIDLGQPLAGRAGMLQSDDEHPTVAGQQVLLQTVSQALAADGVTG